jgi:phage-related protein (TIGR01555 family)
MTLKGQVEGKNIVFQKKTFDSFVNFVAKLGIQADNLSSGGHYAFGPFLSRNRQELEASYRSSWIVGQVIDALAEDMTRDGFDLVCDMDPGKLSDLSAAIDTMSINHALCSTIKWARLFGGALAIMLIDGQNPETPLKPETVRPDQFKGLLVLDRWLVNPPMGKTIQEFGPDFGMPMFYDVIGDLSTLPNIHVHHSRVIRFDGIELPYMQRRWENGWGESVIERMHDRLIAFDSVTQGTAQLIYKAYLRGVGVKGLREALSVGGKVEEAVIKQFDYMRQLQSNEGITLLDSNDTFWTHQYTFSGLPECIIQFGQQISGATGIPLVRLFGMSPAGMNSTGESDIRTYYDNVKRLQETHLKPQLMKKLFPVLFRSVLKTEMPKEFKVTFKPLWQSTDKEKADLGKTVADAVDVLYNSGLIGRKTALLELKQTSQQTGMFTNISDETIEEADDEVKEAEMNFGNGVQGFQSNEPKPQGPKENES